MLISTSQIYSAIFTQHLSVPGNYKGLIFQAIFLTSKLIIKLAYTKNLFIK